jgi:hypothetical protein
LRDDVKHDYLRMAVESYAKNQNEELAKQRWAELGDEGPALLKDIQNDPSINSKDIVSFGKQVEQPLTQSAPLQPSSSEVAKTPKVEKTAQPEASLVPGSGSATEGAGISETTTPSETSPKPAVNPYVLLSVFCVLTLIIGAVLVYLLFLRRRVSNKGGEEEPELKSVARTQPGTDTGGYGVESQEAPIAHFITTYMLGDDLYDDSFSIDSPTGEFLGECGVGISDTIGVGDPKKVTAFEVWLFDKNDIQTITKVLMSDHAFHDPQISQRLISKGEPVEVEAGKPILLETATLQLEARIVDMNYGQGALPERSFFDRMTLELSIWPKAAA